MILKESYNIRLFEKLVRYLDRYHLGGYRKLPTDKETRELLSDLSSSYKPEDLYRACNSLEELSTSLTSWTPDIKGAEAYALLGRKFIIKLSKAHVRNRVAWYHGNFTMAEALRKVYGSSFKNNLQEVVILPSKSLKQVVEVIYVKGRFV